MSFNCFNTNYSTGPSSPPVIIVHSTLMLRMWKEREGEEGERGRGSWGERQEMSTRCNVAKDCVKGRVSERESGEKEKICREEMNDR